jgi:hypothetical protein
VSSGSDSTEWQRLYEDVLPSPASMKFGGNRGVEVTPSAGLTYSHGRPVDKACSPGRCIVHAPSAHRGVREYQGERAIVMLHLPLVSSRNTDEKVRSLCCTCPIVASSRNVDEKVPSQRCTYHSWRQGALLMRRSDRLLTPDATASLKGRRGRPRKTLSIRSVSSSGST